MGELGQINQLASSMVVSCEENIKAASSRVGD